MKARIIMMILAGLLVVGLSGCTVRLRGSAKNPPVEKKDDPPVAKKEKKHKKDEPIVGEGDRRDEPAGDRQDHPGAGDRREEHPGDGDPGDGGRDKGGPPPHAHGLLKIPPGHLPPPGQCRIWVPGVPPGRQRRAADCSILAAEVPPGAWLLHRGTTEPDRVEVTVYDAEHIGIIIEIQIYDVVTGEFLGHEEHAAKK